MGKVARILVLLLTLFCSVRAMADDPKWFPEEQVVAFPEGKTFDFGDILIADGPVKCSFTFQNVAAFPIVIHNIISSCGCTTPTWPHTEIAPGGKGTIAVTFTNDQGPFPFDKTLTVYFSNLRRPVLLHVRGVSHDKKKSLAERFPDHLGPLGLRTNEVNLGNLEQGKAKADRITLANLSAEPLQVEMVGADPGLTFAFSLHSDPLVVRVFLRDDFSGWSTQQVASGAKAVPVQSYHEFGEVKAGTPVKARYTIRNTGQSDLIIRTVEFESGEGASRSARVETRCPLTIRPGGSATLRVSLNTEGLKGEVLDVLTLVTNAPAKPLVNLFLTGYVVSSNPK